MRSSSSSPDPSARRRVVALYVVAGVAWILLSDLALVRLGWLGDLGQTVKGAGFVATTAVVLAVLLRRHDRRLERERATRADRERDLASILEVAQDVIYRIELEPRRFSYISPAVERMLGISPQEVVRDPASAERFVHPDDRALREATAGDEVIRLRWRHRDGRTLWTEQRNRVQLEDGGPVAIVGVARDITGEVLGATVRDVGAELERAVLEGAPTGQGLTVVASTLRRVVEARHVRVTVAAMPGESSEIEVVDGAPQRDAIAMTAESGLVRIEVVPSGHTPAGITLAPLLERLAVRIDHAAQHERRRRELERVEVALQATGIAILLTDDDGRITWSNTAFVELSGYRHDELRSRSLALLAPDARPDLRAASVERVMSGERYVTELTLHRKDGSGFLAGIAVTPVRGADGRVTGAVASVLDLTEERRASDELHAAQLAVLSRQRDLERQRTMLVQTLSHELRTPLTIVLGAAQTLQRDALPVEARARLVRSLERGTDDLLHHLDAVLAATDGLTGEVVATTGRAVLAIALDRLGSRHDLERIRIDGDAAWTGPATEAAGLLRPLLHNALKFSPDDTPVEVAIRTSAVEAGCPGEASSTSPAFVVFEVVDHGPGIPGNLVPVLATPFRQADSSVTRAHGGLGLGLHAARRSADRLGAGLVTTTGPDGTRVRVELPLVGFGSDVVQAGGSSASAISRT